MTATQSEFLHVELARIAFSASHAQAERRKHFDKDALAELADNIKGVGIVQPVVLRRLTDGPTSNGFTFELVAGERRVLAAKQAGLETVPAMVHDLDDDQALDVQLIENLQREGLHPLVEAEGYEDLRKRGHSIAEIAEKVGKSESYVYKRIELTACAPAVRKAFYEDKIDASRALLLSRIKPEASQAEALKEILEGWGGPMSYRQALDHIRRQYMCRLDEAPFKTEDAKLVPTAGACSACPKNTSRQGSLFGDVSKQPAHCTDGVCYQSKVKAHTAQVVAIAQERGQTVISGKAAEKLLPHGYLKSGAGYVELDDQCYDDSKGRTYKQLVGKSFTPILIVTDDGESKEVARLDDIKNTLKEKGVKKVGERSSPNYDQQHRQKIEKAKAESEIRRTIYATLRPKLKTFTRTEEIALCKLLLEKAGQDEEKELQRLWDPESKLDWYQWSPKFEKRLDEMTDRELTTLLFDFLFIGELKASSWGLGSKPELLLGYADREQVDHKAIRKTLVDAAAAKKKAKKSKSKK